MESFGKTNRKLSGRRLLIVLFVSIALLLSVGGVVLAKYLTLLDADSPISSADFYFESDLLSATSSPHYTLMAGVDEIRFNLKNHPDTLRHSDCDITYKVTLSKDGAEVDSKTGYLTITDSEKFITSEVVFLDLDAGIYTVTAEATAPYTATLSARFELVATVDDLVWSVSDVSGSPFASLTIETVDYEGDVSIKWPSGTQPDVSDPLMIGAVGNTHAVHFEKNSEYVITFFKTNPTSIFTKSDFEVEKAPTP